MIPEHRPSTTMSDLNIAIIGAGPAGRMLARLLYLAGIPATVFEAERSIEFRFQGATLDLGKDSGLKALKQANLYSEFLKYARFDGEAMIIADKNLVKHVELSGSDETNSRGRPEIDRVRLREILVDSLPKERIVWGKRLKSVGSDLTLSFEDGFEKGFDLVVGADGANSRVRPLLSSTQLVYSGVGGFQGAMENAQSTHPELYKFVNRGSVFVSSDNKFMSMQQVGDGSLAAAFWIVTDERHTQKVDPKDAGSFRKSCQEAFRDWDPLLLDFFDYVSDDSLVYRSLHLLPVANSWEHQPGATLIGDAAHVMLPFAGEGVNLALSDATALAEAIIKTKDMCNASISDKKQVVDTKAILSQNVKAFEADMFQRAKKWQQITYDNTQLVFFNSTSVKDLVAHFGKAIPEFLPKTHE